MPRGASPEREHEYEELVSRFKKEHRYPGREEEVAARIVNKQRAELHETKADEAADAHGEEHNAHLPLKGYDHLTIEEITHELGHLRPADVHKLRDYEHDHRRRKTLLEHYDRHLA